MTNPLTSLKSASTGRVLAILLGTTLLSAAALARRVAEPAAVPERIGNEASVGLIRPTDVSSVIAPAALTIAEVVVAPGDEVAAGAPIARLDRSEADRELAHLTLELERATENVAERERTVAWTEHTTQRLVPETTQASADVAMAERENQQVPMRQARDSPERAQVAYDKAVLKARRAEQLAASGLLSKQEVEDARFEVNMAADDLLNARKAAEAATRLHTAEQTQARARQDLSVAEQRRQLAQQQAELREARITLEETRLRYETTRAAIGDAFVRAGRAGAILEIPVHAGDRVPAGTLIAKMAPLDPVAIEVDVPANVVNLLQVGGPARVDVPAVKLVDADAQVRSIAPLPGEDGRYSIQLTLANPKRAHLAGQSAHVKLFASRVSQR
jgi:multidrug resistance efflux pump